MSTLSGFDLEQARRGLTAGTPGGDPGPGTTLPRVTPYNGAAIAAGYGIQGQAVRTDLVYAGANAPPPATYRATNIDAWVDLYAAMGAAYVRTRYNPSHPGSARVAARCRLRGLKVLWSVIPEGQGTSDKPTDQTPAETTAAVQSLIANVADVTLAIEGLNEPNHNRNGTAVLADWATNPVYGAVPHQAALYAAVRASTVMAGVQVLGPSLHDINTDKSYTDVSPAGGVHHFEQMAAAGIRDVQDVAGIHSYQGQGNPPTHKLATRIARIDNAYGAGYPIWVTETGYTNAIANLTSGHAIATEAAAATYGPRMLLEFAGGFTLNPPRHVRLSRFEGLDDYDPGPKDVVEANFGLWRVSNANADASYDPSTWTPKPEVAKTQAVLDLLKAPASTPAYTPSPVGLKVTRSAGASDVRTMLVQRHDGALWLFLWRNQPVMDTATKDPIAVGNVPVTVEDAFGPRIVLVNGEVSWITVSR